MKILVIGELRKALDISPTSPGTEIYSHHRSSTGLDFAGLITHSIIMATSQQQLAGIDRAKNNLQANIKDEQHKWGKVVNIGSSPPMIKRRPVAAATVLRPNSRPDGSRNAGLSKPASPAINAFGAKSAHTLGPARISASARSRKDLALIAAKRPVIHLLAVRPITARAVSKEIGLPEQDLNSLLSKYGKQCSERDPWELSDRSYRELDIWSFKYVSMEDRHAAQDNARRAFDRMRTPISDTKIWDKLNAPADRNKGICLSKLKIGNGAKGLDISGTSNQAPSDHRRLLAGAGGDPLPRPKSSQSNLNRVMNGQKPLKHPVTPKVNVAGTKSPSGAEKASSEKGKARPVAKNPPRQKSNVKQFKSDEFIIDEVEDEADLEQCALTKTKSSQSFSSPEKAKQDIPESSGKKRKATTEVSDREQRKTSSTTIKNTAKRLKTSNEGKQVRPSQSAGAQKVESSHGSISSTKPTAISISSHTSNEVKKSTDRSATSKRSDGRDTDPKTIATEKPGDPKAGQKATKSESESTSERPAPKQTTSKPTSKHQSNPSSSHSDTSSGSPATMEEYRILQTKYLRAFRKNLHLRLMIYTMPPDILTPADQTRSDDAAADSEGLSDTIKSFLIECSERELNLLGMNPRDIAKLAKQDKAFDDGVDVDPWVLLPDHHAQIVDEVVGWREYTKVKMVQLLMDYDERRTAYDGMEKGSEVEKTEKDSLHERALAIKCLEAINSR